MNTISAHNKLTDEQLVLLLKNDKHSAFTEIYKRYAGTLAGFVNSKIYDLEEARDILHDLFIKIWEDRQNLNITISLRAYLFASARYRVVDKIRKNINHEKYSSLVQSFSTQSKYDITDILAAKELSLIVQNSLNKLPNYLAIT
jgi:DNA-directed RNA polymerase specialized sigma24 family protein